MADNKLVERAKRGDKQAFSQLMAEHDTVLKKQIREELPRVPEPKTALLVRKIVREVHQALFEFTEENESFDVWLRRKTSQCIRAERIAIIQAKKGDRNALERLVADYEKSIRTIFQASFKLSEESLKALHAEPVPEEICIKLQSLKNRGIIGEKHFLKAVSTQIGEEQTFSIQVLILKHALVQDKMFDLSGQSEENILQGIVKDAEHVVKRFHLHEDCFGSWIQELATKYCAFRYIQHQFRRGAKDEAYQVFERYYNAFMLSVLRKKFPSMPEEEREEVLQDLRLRICEILPEFRENRGAFKAWLSKSLWGYGVNRVNQNKKLRENMQPLEKVTYRLADESASPENVIAIHECIHRALDLLPERAREVVVLKDIEGLQQNEIAKLLKVPMGTVQSRLGRAKEKLKTLLEELRCIELL